MDKKRGKGRPKVEFSDKDIEYMERMAALGVPIRTMALIFGVGHATLERRKAENPKIFEAIEKGRAVGDVELYETSHQMAISGKHPNMTIFMCKVRLHMRENDFNNEVIPVDFKELRANVG